MSKEKMKFSAEAKARFGVYHPNEKQMEIIQARIAKEIGKGVTVVGTLGCRYSCDENGQPYLRYLLSNGHTVFVSGFVNEDVRVKPEEVHITVSDAPAKKNSYTVAALLDRIARKADRAKKELALQKAEIDAKKAELKAVKAPATAKASA